MKQNILISFVFILLLCGTVLPQQSEATMDPQAAKHYNNGINFMQEQQYEQAIASFDSSLLFSKDYRIYYQKGNVLLKTGNSQAAKTLFTETTTMNNTFDRGYYSLAGACLILNEFDEAIVSYEKVIQYTQDEKLKGDALKAIEDTKGYKAIDLFNKGNAAMKANNFTEAVSLYDKSIQLTNDSRVHYQKGLALSKLDKTQEAIAAFKSTIALNDSFDLAYVALAGAYAGQKKYQDAITNYEKAQKITKNESLKENLTEALIKTYITAGNEYVKDKKYDSAIETFNKSLALSESDIAYFSLAKVYIEKKQFQKAGNALDKAAQNKKTVSDGAIAYYRGVMALENKENTKAAEQFNIAITDKAYKKAAEAQLDYLKKVGSAKK